MTALQKIQRAIIDNCSTVEEIATYTGMDYDDCFDAILTGIETGDIDPDDVVCPEAD